MEPVQFAESEAIKAHGILKRMILGIQMDLHQLYNDLEAMPRKDQNPGHAADRLDQICQDLDLARTEASRWVFMSQVTHAR